MVDEDRNGNLSLAESEKYYEYAQTSEKTSWGDHNRNLLFGHADYDKNGLMSVNEMYMILVHLKADEQTIKRTLDVQMRMGD